MQQHYLIAVDGGGTKTEFCVQNTDTGKISRYVCGGTNFKAAGEVDAAILASRFAEMCRELEIAGHEITGMVMGLSGCDSPGDLRVFRAAVTLMDIPPERVFLCNDCELAFLSSADRPGICVVAGTGSVTLGFPEQGEAVRCGGWGSPLSDEGSGYWIGAQALRGLIRWCDGRAEPEAVFPRLCALYGCEDRAVLPALLGALPTASVAVAASIVAEEAAKGDAYCLRIIEAAVQQVAELVQTAHRRCAFPAGLAVPIVMTGGVFRGTAFQQAFRCAIEKALPQAELITPQGSPAQNGLRLAQRLYGGRGSTV